MGSQRTTRTVSPTPSRTPEHERKPARGQAAPLDHPREDQSMISLFAKAITRSRSGKLLGLSASSSGLWTVRYRPSPTR